MKRNAPAKTPQRVLVIDIGGTNVKAAGTGRLDPVKIPSGPAMTPAHMVREVKKAFQGWDYQAVSIGYPGMVVQGRPVHDPRNLGPGWVGFDFRKAFGRPVKVINDAAMQAIGSYEGGRMLFLGLGTGLGSAMIVDGIVQPMELAHLPYKNGKTYEDYLGIRGLEHMGKQKWRRYVTQIVTELQAALAPDYVILGGGNVAKIKTLPPKTRLGANDKAFIGGFRMWAEKKGKWDEIVTE